MQNFDLDTSYAIISAIRAGLNPSFSEDHKIGYDIEIAEDICRSTDGYDLIKTIKFIEHTIGSINSGNRI